MKKLFCCLLWALSLRNVALASKCIQSQSKNCIILSLTSSDGEDSLPDLYGKSSLQIKGGSLTTFGEKLANQLRTVEKLQLGPLGLQELFLNQELLDVTATDNQISVIRFRTTEAKYKLQKLDLQRNRLQNLNGFQVLTELVELHLEDNQLESVDLSVFEQMRNLKQLHLDRNMLVHVVATTGIDLPALDHLSLAGNKLSKLDVTGWSFESLLTWDISSNELIYVDGVDIEKQFSSLQTIFLSKNGWHCKWLADTVAMFQKNSVVFGDSDGDNETGVAGFSCVSVESFGDHGLDRLESITKDQENLRRELKENIRKLESYQRDKIRDLRKLLSELQDKSKISLTSSNEPFNIDEFNKLKDQVKLLESKLKEELQSAEQQKMENDKSVRTLESALLQMRKTFQHEVGKVSALQKQFKLLRETTNKLN